MCVNSRCAKLKSIQQCINSDVISKNEILSSNINPEWPPHKTLTLDINQRQSAAFIATALGYATLTARLRLLHYGPAEEFAAVDTLVYPMRLQVSSITF